MFQACSKHVPSMLVPRFCGTFLGTHVSENQNQQKQSEPTVLWSSRISETKKGHWQSWGNPQLENPISVQHLPFSSRPQNTCMGPFPCALQQGLAMQPGAGLELGSSCLILPSLRNMTPPHEWVKKMFNRPSAWFSQMSSKVLQTMNSSSRRKKIKAEIGGKKKRIADSPWTDQSFNS